MYNLIEHDRASQYPFLLWHVVVESVLGNRVKPVLPEWASPYSESFPFLLMACEWEKEGGCWLNRTIFFFLPLTLKCRSVCFGPKQVQWISWSIPKGLGPHYAAAAKRHMWWSPIWDFSAGIGCTGLAGHKALADFPWDSLLFSLALSYKCDLRVGGQEPAGVHGIPQSWGVSFFYGNEANSLLMTFVQLYATLLC